MDVTY